MARKKPTGQRGEMLQGTLDMLVLKTILLGPAHGHTIAHVIEKTSEDVLEVDGYAGQARVWYPLRSKTL